MSGIVVLPVTEWWLDCPHCGVDQYGHGAGVIWFAPSRGICETGHFLAYVARVGRIDS
jgi:hypothetical protein